MESPTSSTGLEGNIFQKIGGAAVENQRE